MIKKILVLVISMFVAEFSFAAIANNVFGTYQIQVDDAIDKALLHLYQTQTSAGYFSGEYGKTTAVPSLVGMAYLAAGYTPASGPYSDAIQKCIDYCLEVAEDHPKAYMGGPDNGKMYAHNIATLFLSEVSGMVDEDRQKRIDELLPKALQLILDAQRIKKADKHKGGWRYAYNSSDSDFSCSGWALMALRSAKLNGAPIPDKSIDDAVKYVKRVANKDTGGFGYQDPGSVKQNLAGAGILCLELTGHHGDPMLQKTGNYILNRVSHYGGSSGHAEYGRYYAAQGMFQLGGKYWKTWADWMFPYLLKTQQDDGSWGGTYVTAMNILSITVPCRQLPIYQRDETVNDE
jgi:hypothetical protein